MATAKKPTTKKTTKKTPKEVKNGANIDIIQHAIYDVQRVSMASIVAVEYEAADGDETYVAAHASPSITAPGLDRTASLIAALVHEMANEYGCPERTLLRLVKAKLRHTAYGSQQ